MLTPTDLDMLDLSRPLVLYLPDETATARLGALIAPRLKVGDVVYLHGELGAGKSSLARGLIRALTHADEDVPSPTFTLMQTYDAAAFSIVHLDLYRLQAPEESYELGLDDALATSVLVIEWPDKLAHLGFDDRLDIVLKQADEHNMPDGAHGGRIATLTPVGRLLG